VAVELGALGATVYVTAHSHGAADVAAEVSAAGGRGEAVPCDLTVDEDTRRLVDRIIEQDGRLDIVAYGAIPSGSMDVAGPDITGGAPFWERPADWFGSALSVSVRSQLRVAQLTVPSLQQSDIGLFASIASAGAVRYFQSVFYGVCKAATDRLVRDMARELRDTCVSCVSVWPGWVLTEAASEAFASGYGRLRERLHATWAPFPDRDRVLAAMTEKDLEECFETPRFTGRAIGALALDPQRKALSGQAHAVVNLADHYGFTDVTGRSPDPFRLRERSYWPGLS
jgi:NAD(P)-dependent dehydrogenase (short-subunit alcohol dehydrogenase family)